MKKFEEDLEKLRQSNQFSKIPNIGGKSDGKSNGKSDLICGRFSAGQLSYKDFKALSNEQLSVFAELSSPEIYYLPESVNLKTSESV